MSNKTNRILSWKERLSYGSGDFGLNLYWQSVGFFLLFFYTDVLGLPNKTAGLIFLIGGVWDAISDPLMGYIAERSTRKESKYKPFIIGGAIPLALSGMLLFSSPTIDNSTLKALYVLIALLVFRTCYTIVSIPYSTLGARLTSNPSERTQLSAVRMYCGVLGGLAISASAFLLRAIYNDQTAFQILGVAIGLVSVAMLYHCYRNTTEIIITRPSSAPAANLKELAGSLIANKPFVTLLLGIFFVTFANTFFLKNLLYYFEYYLGSKQAGNTAFFILTAIPLVSIPFWSLIAVRWGKRKAWQLGGLVMAAAFCLTYFDHSGTIWSAFLAVGLFAWGSSAYAVLLWSMLPDVIDYGEFKTGVRNESMAIGLLSSVQKVTIGGSALIISLSLDTIGYQAGMVQSNATLEGLNRMISIGPLLAVTLSMLAMRYYPLTGSGLAQLQESE